MGVVSTIQDFSKSKFNIGLLIALVLIGTFLLIPAQTQETPEQEKLAINYFYLPTCPHCADQKPIILEIQQENPDIPLYFHDASTQEGSAKFYQMAVEAGMDTTLLGTPTTFAGKTPLVGVHSKEEILAALEECKKACAAQSQPQPVQEVATGFTEFDLPFLGRTDLMSFSLPALAIVLGLVDGFNPCAMWVLVYLIALLIDLEDRKKIWIIIGTFILASATLYFLFMTAWLNAFLLLGYVRPVTILIGLVALGGGILSIKEYLATKGKLACKASDEESNRKTMSRIQRIVAQPLSLAVFLGIFALAFMVNSVEFVCSAAIPAVFTQILAISSIPAMEQYFYILLYILFFMLDDIIIFSLAAFAINSKYGEKYARYCKAIGGIVLLLLGIMLLFAPHLLR